MLLLNAALRAEAALRARLPKDAKRNAAISPYDKGLGDANSVDPYQSETEEHKFPCVGELMQHAKKGTHLSKSAVITDLFFFLPVAIVVDQPID